MTSRDLEDVLDKKVLPLVDDAIKQQLGFSVESIIEDLAQKMKRVPFLFLDIDTTRPFKQAKDAFFRQFLTRLIAVHRGNIQEAAQTAGVARRSLHRLIQRLHVPVHQIRRDLIKRTYIYEQNISQAITTTLDQYKQTFHPKKMEGLQEYVPLLSKDIARELPHVHMKLADAETIFERHYFKELMKRFKTVAQAARHAELRSETVHRKLTELRLR